MPLFVSINEDLTIFLKRPRSWEEREWRKSIDSNNGVRNPGIRLCGNRVLRVNKCNNCAK